MKIIVSGDGYPEKRNIITNAENDYLNFRWKNKWLYLNIVRRKVLKKNKKFVFQTFPPLIPRDAQVTHLFNEVSANNTRWVSTFETELPRVLPVNGVAKTDNPELHQLLKRVAADECLGIVAISEATRNIQLQLLDAFPHLREKICRKMHVLHPPQPLLNQQESSRSTAGPLCFTFIGNEFYRKGGAEVVLAFAELEDEGVVDAGSVLVNLIGDLNKKHNIAHRRFQDDAAFYGRIETLLAEKALFRHFSNLPNSQVLDLLRQSHAGLLPTWQDTYGFSVLEMQACGCPVITTNVRALPEINPERAGWLLKCPLNAMHELDVDSAETKTALRKRIVSQLKAQIIDIMQNREQLHTRSAASLERIQQEHDPVTFNQVLKNIYGGVA